MGRKRDLLYVAINAALVILAELLRPHQKRKRRHAADHDQ